MTKPPEVQSSVVRSRETRLTYLLTYLSAKAVVKQLTFVSGAPWTCARNKPFGEAMGNNHPNMASTGYFGLPRGISARHESELLLPGA